MTITGSFEKRVILDDSTARIFEYAIKAPSSTDEWARLLEVRDVHWLIDGVSYVTRVYTTVGTQSDRLNLQLEFETDRSALTTPRNLEPVMRWRFHPDRLSAPRVYLDGDHILWSQN